MKMNLQKRMFQPMRATTRKGTLEFHQRFARLAISVVSQRPWWDLLSSETFKLMNRGLVEYITESGDALRRREFTQGYACIKYCVSFFE